MQAKKAWRVVVVAVGLLAVPLVHADEPAAEYWTTYSGSVPPLKLSGPLTQEAAEASRDPYFMAWRNPRGKPARVVKMVDGKVQLEDKYTYYDNGNIKRRETHTEDNVVVLIYTFTGDLERSFNKPK